VREVTARLQPLSYGPIDVSHPLKAAELVYKWGFDFRAAIVLLHDVADHLNRSGRTAEADTWFLRAIRLGRGQVPDLTLAQWYREHSWTLQDGGQLSRAEAAARRCLKIRSRLLRPDDPQVANAMNQLANAYLVQGRINDAGRLYARSREICLSACGDRSDEYAWALSNCTPVLVNRGELEKACKFCNSAYIIKNKVLGHDHLESSYVLNHLAVACGKLGRHDEEDRHFERSLAIREDACGSPLHPCPLGTRNRWVESLTARHLLREATDLCNVVLDAPLGHDHPQVAVGLRSYARLLRFRHRTAEAERYEERARAVEYSLSVDLRGRYGTGTRGAEESGEDPGKWSW
jgi:tetratricopeptide (TPR) repeat protein